MANVEGATQEKASALDVKRELARARRRHKHDPEINYLNITPMLDMMTIILVFLLKSLASSAGNIPQSDDLRLPHSSADLDPSGALQVIVSRVSITVNGKFIVALRGGLVDPGEKRGGTNGFVINKLLAEMADQENFGRRIAAATNQPFKGELALIADQGIPARTIYEVLYTSGQHGFSNFQLLVLKNGSR